VPTDNPYIDAVVTALASIDPDGTPTDRAEDVLNSLEQQGFRVIGERETMAAELSPEGVPIGTKMWSKDVPHPETYRIAKQ
jgi:hypothetical protein